MKFPKSLLFFVLLGVSSPCFCSDKIDIVGFDAVIHTYGGLELFRRVFNAVAMLFYGNGNSGLDKTFHAVVVIATAVGFVVAIYSALNKDGDLQIIKKYLLSTFIVAVLVLTPRTRVVIQDHLIQSSSSSKAAVESVDNVPVLLAVTSQLISTLSYHMTDLLEKVMHQGDELYNWTGHIYAGDNFFKMQRGVGLDRTTDANLREFCRECVWRDLGMGLYTHERLSNESNLITFFKDRTSRIRMMPYLSDKGKEWKSCKSAIEEIENSLKNQSKLPNSKLNSVVKESLSEEQGLKFLMNKSTQTLEELKRQKMFIETIKEEIPGTLNSFAAKRAEMIQKENQKLLGALGASSIVAMKNFFEAVIILMFPIILIICLISYGFKPLGSWLQFSCWVNIWPLFYVIVNFLLTSLWNLRKASLNITGQGLSLHSFDGLVELYDSMESVAAIAMAFIPFLSWALIKGGISQLVHLASSLTAPAQAGASMAAVESVSGNYSLGNVSVGNTSGYNYDAFKQNFNPGLSHGSISVDQGAQSMTYLPNEGRIFVRQGMSQLREGFSQTDTLSHSVQKQLQDSESAVLEQGNSFSTSLSDSSNKAVALMEAYSSSAQHGENVNLQESTGAQKTFQRLDSMAKEYAKTNNVSYDQSIREQMEAGFNLKVIAGATASSQDGVSKSDGMSLGSRGSQSENFVDLMQEASSYSQSELGSFMKTEDLRRHEDFSKSWNETSSSADQLRAAHSKQQSLSHLEGELKSENFAFHKNLDQQFVEHLSEKFSGDTGELNRVLDLPSSHPEKKQHVDEFVSAYSTRPIAETSIQDTYHEYETHLSQRSAPLEDIGVSRAAQSKLNEYEFDQGSVKEQFHNLKRLPQDDLSSKQKHLHEQVDGLKDGIDIKPSEVEGRNEHNITHYAKDDLVTTKYGNKLVKKLGEGSGKILAAINKNPLGRKINKALDAPSSYIAQKIVSLKGGSADVEPSSKTHNLAHGNGVHFYGKGRVDQ